MLNTSVVMDMPTIRKMGIEALTEKLGPIGVVEFMHEFDSGYGDYTNERHNWLNNLSINEICDEINTSKKGI
ncbi:MAG: hypothetical protein LBG73_07505 [Spirochaetaceae bacterium]|nr:hypothetical protein [Spirochaetaceae bacterium]